MKRCHGILAFASLFGGIAFGDLKAKDAHATASFPFAPGERLSFRIKWGFLSVGTAVLATHEPEEVNGTRCHKISLAVSTNKFADAFYKVRTRAVSYVEEGFGRTILYRKNQLEGKTNRDVEVRFDYENNIATTSTTALQERSWRYPIRCSTRLP